ncbi:MAG: aspartate aminotransferase family protein [Agathobacter sp.]|nr:aspartate aminotransferase family protein [Agathobacter sp.]
MSNMNYSMEKAENALLHTYNRFPIVFDHGKGVYLYDTDGKEYLDFAAGIAVCSLGYGDETYTESVKNQVDKLLHTSNLFYNEPTTSAAEKLLKVSGMDRVFFTNSGTEAIEGAMKAAKKYAYTRDGHAGHEIIAMNHSFHGRSLGALSVTGTEKYRTPFGPLIPGIKFAEFNDLESVKAAATENTCAILLETVQGEGGIYPATQEFLEGVRALCDEKDILLILDEIQCGMGRCGEMFAYQAYGIQPDILTSAKALGCGVPVGAFLMTEKVAEKSLAPGDHGTTYGGNPLVGAAVSTVLDIYEERNVVSHVKEISNYFETELDKLVQKYEFITARRGMGLMQGLVLTVKPADVCNKALEKGLIVISAGSDVLRLVPPLVIEKSHVDEMISKLESAFSEIIL